MRTTDVLLSGLAGAGLVTATHETLKRNVPAAPRMDLLGMQALRKLIAGARAAQPATGTLFLYSLAGDLLANALYYSLGGMNNRNVILRSTALGIAAGLGAVFMPGPMGLDPKRSRRTTATALMTVGLYTLGGLATGLALKWLQRKREPKHIPGSLIL